jgi:hypothetical protein
MNLPDSGELGDQQVIDRFMQNWTPYSTLRPGNRARTSLARFLAAATREDRARALEYASALSRLQRIYGELGILRTGRAFDPYAELLELTAQKFADAIRQGHHPEWLTLLQHAFEFGKHPVLPPQQAARTFLLEFWALRVSGPTMKYCIYINGVPYSGGGKTHEEMARQFVHDGLGSGSPMCGGQINRTDDLVFEFDVGSTAFHTSMRHEEVRQVILRSIHATGGDETRVTLKHHGKAGRD